jgi:REP element-mobilizing transposase RayT
MHTNRRSVRLPEYSYRTAGAYFITLCSFGKKNIFGDIIEDQVQLSSEGQQVEACWKTIPEHFPHSSLDIYVVMPNHFHGIIWLNEDPPLPQHDKSIQQERFAKPVSGSVSTIIRSFKAAATRNINQLRKTSGEKLWQRGFYERVIRNEDELRNIKEYILNNPLQWALDSENPDRVKKQFDPYFWEQNSPR